MRVMHDFANRGQRAETLVILLPGALQQADEFAKAGFIADIRARDLPVDLLLADLGLQHIGDSTSGVALQRIDEALVQPARQQGYGEIWLAGVSIGGFIALDYAVRYPGKLDGVCMLGPYPGNRMLQSEIEAADLAGWDAGVEPAASGDGERMAWYWLRRYTESPARPRIHLGYGVEDRFAAGQRLMASMLPKECVQAVQGAHDWTAWRCIWNDFLDRLEVETRETMGMGCE